MTVTIELNNLVNLQNENTAVTQINQNSETIEGGFTTALNVTGDRMQGTLDMNSNQVINLPQPATANSPLRLQDLNVFTGGGTVSNIPAGGMVGDVLTKYSSTNYDTVWSANSADITSGTNIVTSGSNPVTIATVTSPVFNAIAATSINVSTVSSSSLTTSSIMASTINLTGNMTATATFNVIVGGSTAFSLNNGGTTPYNIIYDSAGNQAFYIGGGGSIPDPTNYYRNTAHAMGTFATTYLGVVGSAVNVYIATSSTTPTTGALIVAGGLGVTGNIYSGATINAPTLSVSTGTFSTITASTINATTVTAACPAGTLSGTTLASNVVSSSLASVGTITTGTWNATAITATSLSGTTLANGIVASSLTSVGVLAGASSSAPIVLPRYTVTTLPVTVTGAIAIVTDAIAPTFLGTLTGGGTTKAMVFYNGSAWVSG